MSATNSNTAGTTTSANTATTTTSTHKYLTQYNEGHQLVDALPYVDYYDDNLKKQVNYLVEQEMKQFKPKDYLAPLGETATFELKGTSVTHADYARTARGEAMPKLDMKRYEVSQDVLQSHDVNQIVAATAKLELASEYDANQSDNLELLNRYGSSAWKVQLQGLQTLGDREKAALKKTQQAIVDVNAKRKADQIKAGERLYSVETDFFTLSAKNVQIATACDALEAEIDELNKLQVQIQQQQQ